MKYVVVILLLSFTYVHTMELSDEIKSKSMQLIMAVEDQIDENSFKYITLSPIDPPDKIEKLIDSKADVNYIETSNCYTLKSIARLNSGKSPLNVAAARKDPRLVEYLISKKADPQGKAVISYSDGKLYYYKKSKKTILQQAIKDYKNIRPKFFLEKERALQVVQALGGIALEIKEKK